MLTDRGEVKLFDFGIVKAIGRIAKSEEGVVKGNIAFMSPEQARSEPVDARSDLFSLGLVIYYGLTDEHLYQTPAAGSNTSARPASGRRPRSWPGSITCPLAGPILRRALAVDPALRYQTAAEFASDVAPHAAGTKAEAGRSFGGCSTTSSARTALDWACRRRRRCRVAPRSR